MDFPPEVGASPEHFRTGDPVEFYRDWDPGFAPDDPFYREPVPAGSRGQVVDVGSDYVRVRMEDRQRWSTPLTVWQEGRFPDEVVGGLSCLRKLG